MEELKRRWFQIVWAGLLLCSIVLAWMRRGVDAAWAHSHTMDVCQSILDWIVIPMTVILFILHCVENWRTGERYFWRKWRRWGSNLFLGTLMAIVVFCIMKFLPIGAEMFAPDNADAVDIIKKVVFGLLAVGGFVYMLARYKFNHSKRG